MASYNLLEDFVRENNIVALTYVPSLRRPTLVKKFCREISTNVRRGAKVAFELEEYEKRGIHVITFISKKYPVLLRQELKNKKPPVLFYSGDIY